MTTYLIYYIDQIYFQNWMCVWLYFKNLLWFLFSFLCFLSFFFFLEKTFFCKKLNNLFAPPNKMYVVFLNQHLKKGQHSKTLSSHKWFRTTKKLRWENVLKNSISEIHKNQKIHLRRSFFWKKAKNGFKARNHCQISQNLGWAPHFLKDGKKVQIEWLPVLKPSKIISRIKKIYFIYSKRLGNKNSWRFVSAYIFHSKIGIFFV